MEKVSKDARFSHITKDLRFRRMSKNTQKVKIDKRFKDMFTDKRFKLKYSVDKRGKPMNTTTNENLKNYYELSDSDDSDDDNEDNSEDDSEDDSEGDVKAAEKSGNQARSKTKETTKLLKDNFKKGLNSDSVKKESVSGKKKNKQKVTDSGKKKKKTKEVRSDSEKEDVIDQNSKKTSKKKVMKDRKKAEIKVTEEDDSSSDEEEDQREEEIASEENSEDEDSGLGEGPDLARGEGNVETSSSEEDDESEEEEENQEEFDHGWGELDKDVDRTEELGHRLAVCNMDWDRIKAQDIFVLLHSFVPTGGSIRSVKVYPSEFGLQRMKEEALSGPTELVQDKRENPPEAEGEEEDYEESQGTRYHREKLRRYQLNRLKYYYAVVETDCIETASKIYEECDGMEYESSSTKLDLRFIPDDMEFTEESKSVCTEMPAAYNPSLFVSTALAQSKVNLTWDETDQDRIKVTMNNLSQRKKTDDVNEEDFRAYLASSSEEEEDNDEDRPVDDDDNDNEDDNEERQIQKYRSLLQSLDDDKDQKKKKEVEMEVTWEPGLKETTEKIVKHKEKMKVQTPWDQYLMKKKEKRQRKREERLNRKMTSDKKPEEKAAFSDDDLPTGVDEDPFFNQNLNSDEEVERKPKAESKKTKKKKRKEKTSKSMTKDGEGELELLMMDEEIDNRKHFNLKSIMKNSNKKKKLSGDQKPEGDFQMNVKDDRFTAIFDSHLYNIDPSAPEFKKTKSMEAIIEEKLKRRTSEKTQKTVSGQKRKSESNSIYTGHSGKSGKADSDSISSLIHSVKSKTLTFQNKKRKK
ncbi:ESF1 homolog [Saccostrea cucullata]|uniref:ESF1 homolog n=1 Tax=Saccostrea cuccullata TaxID=36930 RepID=UPI002ED45728